MIKIMALNVINRKLLTYRIMSKVIKSHSRSYAKMLSDPENKGTRQDHVNFDTLGTWDNRIDFSLMLQQSIKHGKPIPKIITDNIGTATVVGRRNTNEDRYTFSEIAPNLHFFAIFDGHGGSLCADYCNTHMESHIRYWLKNGENDLSVILENSFIEINNAFAKFVTYSHPVEDSSGTTATVCLLRNSIELVIAHVGDSRALLCRSGDSRRITNDHTADLKAEKDRIMKSGGMITTDSYGRSMVNGRLAMTRSIGDLDLKPYGVLALPDIRSTEIKHGKDAFLILTTDGVNFVMNDQEVINAVQSCGRPKDAAQIVVDGALHYACEDNATAIVIPFGAWGKYKNHRKDYQQFYSFGRELLKTTRF